MALLKKQVRGSVLNNNNSINLNELKYNVNTIKGLLKIKNAYSFSLSPIQAFNEISVTFLSLFPDALKSYS